MTCPYSHKCWRLSYSKYLQDKGYTNNLPPDRYSLLLAGYATAAMMPRGGLFAEQFPVLSEYGHENLCPDMALKQYSNCHEYIKETNRVERRKATMEANKLNGFKGNRRLPIPLDIRKKVASKARYKCAYCNRAHNSTCLKTGNKVRTVVDHVIPLRRGGLHIESNFVLACRQCNGRKSTDIWEFGCMVGAYEGVSGNPFG